MSRHSENWASLSHHTTTQARLLREYEAQVNRIERTIRSAEARGYSVNRERLGLNVPSVLRQSSVARVKNIKSEDIYRSSKYTTPSGKVVSGKKGRQMERSAAARKGAQTKRRKKERKENSKEKYGPERTPHKEKSGENYSPASFYEQYIEEFLDLAYDCAGNRNHGKGDFDIYEFWCDFIAHIVGEYGEDAVGAALSEAAEAGYCDRETFYYWNLTLDAQMRIADILLKNRVMTRKEYDEFNELISNVPDEDHASMMAVHEAADDMMAQW